MKKLKVLVSLLAMFSLFSLISVSAMEKKNEYFNKNILNENVKEQQNNNINICEQEVENFNKEKDINFSEYSEEESFGADFYDQHMLETLKINKHEKNIYEDDILLNEINKQFTGKKTKQQYPQNLENKTQILNNNENVECKEENNVVNKPEEENMKKKIEKLSQKFSGKMDDEVFGKIFRMVMCSYGEYEKGSHLFSNKISINAPHLYKPVPSTEAQDEYEFKRLDFKFKKRNKLEFEYGEGFNDLDFEGEDKDLFAGFYKKGSKISARYGAFLLEIFRMYYKSCFKENLNSSIVVFKSNNEKREISKEELEDILKYNIFLLYNYKEKCAELIDTILTEAYLKSFFINCSKKYYDFYDRNGKARKDLIKFSEICSRALKIEINENGYLDSMKLDFGVIDNKEDKQFLNRLYEALRDKQKDKLLYDLSVTTFAFLKNKEFWNKMFEIIVYFETVFKDEY